MKTMHMLALSAVLLSIVTQGTSTLLIASTATALTVTASYTSLAVIAALKLLAAGLLAGGAGLLAGGGGGGHGYHRKRREVPENEVDLVFQGIAAVDFYGCGLRLVCELEQKKEQQLEADERLILSLFGRDPVSPAYLKLEAAKSRYDYAAWLGVSGVKACRELFPSCPLDSQQMLQEFRAAAIATPEE